MGERERVKCQMCDALTTRPTVVVVGSDARVRLCPGCVVHWGRCTASLALEDELAEDASGRRAAVGERLRGGA